MTELDPKNYGKGARPADVDAGREWFAKLSRDEALVYRALYHAVARGGFSLFGFSDAPDVCGTEHAPKFVRALIDAVDSARKPQRPVVPTFAEQNATVYARDDWFGSWPEKVVATVEADDFAQHALWERWAMESSYSCPGDKFLWRQRNPGTSALLRGELFDTNVSLTVNEIEGHLVLFWYACSQCCDHALADDWVKRSFPKAVESNGRRIAVDANNFHNAIRGIRSLK